MERKYWDPKIELMNPGEIRILQERQLKEKVKFVYENSPFYRRKFDAAGLEPGDIKNLEDINKIPTTNKNDLKDSVVEALGKGNKPFQEFLSMPEQDIVTIHSTSGTTGIPFTAPYSKNEILERGFVYTGEFLARGFWAAGLRPKDILGHMWNLGGAMVGGGNHIISQGACVPANFMTLVPCHVGRTELILRTLKDVGATAVFCTPSYASYIPEYAQKIGFNLKDLKLKVVMCGGEPGPASIPGLREKLQEAWGAQVFDTYGAPSAIMPYECEAHSGFHIHADINLIQVIDPETKQEVKPGEYGSIVGTTLFKFNEAFPWLRFDTEDRGALIEEPCVCGRTHPRIASVPGRLDDMVKVKGYQLHPNAIEKVVNETEGCTGEFLIVLDKDDTGKDRVSITIEHNLGVASVDEFAKKLEHNIIKTITLKADVKLVPKGSLTRYIMKKQRLFDLRTKEAKEKFEQAERLRSADSYD